MKKRLIIPAIMASAAISSNAAIVFAENLNNTSRTFYAVSNSDLIQSGASTLASGPTDGASAPDSYVAFGSGGPWGLGNVNDGSNSNTGGSIFELQDNGTVGDLNHTITFALNTTTNSLGYDLSSIVLTSNGSDRRAWQDVEVLVRSVGSSSFVSLFRNAYTPTIDSNGSYSAQVTATQNAGNMLLSSGVDAIQFKTYVVGTNIGDGNARSNVVAEFDVLGSATVPEPTTALLSALGALALPRRRR